MSTHKIASIGKNCVACGNCVKHCKFGAITVHKGLYAKVNADKCKGCGNCTKACPANVITYAEKEHIASDEKDSIISTKMNNTTPVKKERLIIAKKRWYDYLWIFSCIYLTLGVFNILFAWLGLICFFTPLLISIIGGNKAYCNKYCGRGQLFQLLGGRIGFSLKKSPPKFLRSKWFRYGFLTFFMTMFFLMLYNTYLVFAGAALKESITLLWTFKLPWHWTNTSIVPPGVAQFAFGFYGVMLTSTVLGLLTMILFKPRSWCVYCPMGTMTQGICKIKHRNL